jgi:hypothetical protein
MTRLLTAFLAASLTAVAQTEPTALTELRSKHESAAASAVAPLNSFYANNLSNLETKLAAAGDYEQARSASAEREALSQASSPVDASRPPITLKMADTLKVNGLTSRTYGTLRGLAGWKSTTYAEWSTQRLAAGYYTAELQLLLSYRTPPPAPDPDKPAKTKEPAKIELSLKDSSPLATAASNRVSFDLTALIPGPLPALAAAGAAPVTPITVKVPCAGLLDLSRPITLQLAASSPPDSDLELLVSEITLLPAEAPAAGATAAGPDYMASLQAIRTSFENKMLTDRDALAKPYVDDLKKLADEAKGELKDEIMDEVNRASRKPKLGPDRAPSRRGLAALGVEGFIELEGVTFVPDASNRGDRFKAQHQGRTFTVKLAFVVTPPRDETDAYAMKATTQGFNVSSADAVALGTSAAEFTALHLEQRPLTLLIRSSQENMSASTPVPALVFIEGTGLLQSQLVDVGLALVEPWKGKQRPPLHRALEEREKLAKSSATPLGAWALSR